MEKIDSDMRDTSELKPPSIDTDILNPFVHRLELDTTYEKLKVSTITI